MIKSNNIKSQCQVCGSEVMIDQFGNGFCAKCGWKQNIASIDFPDVVMPPNIISLNNAKVFFGNGVKFNATFEDFVQMLTIYGEMEFTFNNIRYGVFRTEDKKGNDIVEMFIEGGEVVQIFKNIDEFESNANIDGVLLKNLWTSVVNAGYMQ